MKTILILSLLLAIGMLYLGLFKHIQYATFFGLILILTSAKFMMDILTAGKDEHKDE